MFSDEQRYELFRDTKSLALMATRFAGMRGNRDEIADIWASELVDILQRWCNERVEGEAVNREIEAQR
jgi:hypothetical protein